jgi:aminoglycoside 6'-N-acetyltransferase I
MMDQSAEIIKGIVSDKLTTRTMLKKDMQTYCALFQRIFAQPPWNETWTTDKIHVEVKKIMSKKGFTGIVAEYESQPVGYLTGYRLQIFPFIPSLCYLDQLFVDNRYRGIGIGKSLLYQMVSQVNTHGDCGIVLLTKASSPAEQFYLKHGFKRFFTIIRFNGKVLLYKALR